MGFTFADHAAHRRRGREDLVNGNTPSPGLAQQLLRDHRLQATGQLSPNIGFLFRREYIHQPFHRLWRAAGMQSSQN
ncbi:hypothetical protein D3C75_1215850 [compost metagenome]